MLDHWHEALRAQPPGDREEVASLHFQTAGAYFSIQHGDRAQSIEHAVTHYQVVMCTSPRAQYTARSTDVVAIVPGRVGSVPARVVPG
eukprot:3897843-Rhodomonas_salina.1